MCSLLSTFDSPKVAKANSPIPLHAVVFGDHLTFFSMITFFTRSVTAVLFGDHLTFFSVVKNSCFLLVVISYSPCALFSRIYVT